MPGSAILMHAACIDNAYEMLWYTWINGRCLLKGTETVGDVIKARSTLHRSLSPVACPSHLSYSSLFDWSDPLLLKRIIGLHPEITIDPTWIVAGDSRSSRNEWARQAIAEAARPWKDIASFFFQKKSESSLSLESSVIFFSFFFFFYFFYFILETITSCHLAVTWHLTILRIMINEKQKWSGQSDNRWVAAQWTSVLP